MLKMYLKSAHKKNREKDTQLNKGLSPAYAVIESSVDTEGGAPHQVGEQEILLRSYLAKQKLEFELNNQDRQNLKNTTVIICGGASTISQTMLPTLLWAAVKQVLIVDHSEPGIARILRAYKNETNSRKVVCELGDLRDKRWLVSIFEEYKPNIVINLAAAMSPLLCERYPTAAVRLDIASNATLLDVVLRTSSVQCLVYISSEMAFNPTNCYGYIKRANEQLACCIASERKNLNVGIIRFCNVLDTRGSRFIPTCIDSIQTGKSIKISALQGRALQRRFLPVSVAAKLVIKVAMICQRCEIFYIDENCLSPIPLDELAQVIASQSGITRPMIWLRNHAILVPAQPDDRATFTLEAGKPISDVPLVKVDPILPKSYSQIRRRLRYTLRFAHKAKANTEIYNALQKLFVTELPNGNNVSALFRFCQNLAKGTLTMKS